jgi:glycosyltransferase involved in cell wall biosynthesis
MSAAAPGDSSRAPSSDTAPIRLCVVTTVGMSIQVLYRGRLEYFGAHGFDITCVCAPSELDDAIRARSVRLHTAPLTRSINPWCDLRAVWNLYRFFRRERFDLIEIGTPKAALVAALAARLAGARPVVHLLHGLVYQSDRGFVRWLGRMAQTVPARLADATVSVSASAADDGAADGLCRREEIRILGGGSCNGVDTQHFHPDRRAAGAAVRAELGIAPEAVVFGFIGRMNRDKGIIELTEAWRTIDDAELLLVGDYEDRDRPPTDVVDFIARCPRVHHVGYQSDVVPYYAAMDVLVLPTYREGLPGVLLEGAAMGLPIIATNATGCRDAMEPDLTGLQIPIGDAPKLAAAVRLLTRDRDMRKRMGAAGRAWVTERFDQRRVWDAYIQTYRALVAAARA